MGTLYRKNSYLDVATQIYIWMVPNTIGDRLLVIVLFSEDIQSMEKQEATYGCQV